MPKLKKPTVIQGKIVPAKPGRGLKPPHVRIAAAVARLRDSIFSFARQAETCARQSEKTGGVVSESARKRYESRRAKVFEDLDLIDFVASKLA